MNHKDLDAWKEAIALVKDIYRGTEKFPDSERYGLTNQMRRAAVSVPSNIAEGAARSSDKEFVRFLDVAFGSCAELETQIIISDELGYIENDRELLNQIEVVKKLIKGLMKYLKSKVSSER